uniref:Uncharacterized protein n=1 Tax=Rhizophora mucronata TaxID=61149 RepID=A0A2P2J773_RHIMU
MGECKSTCKLNSTVSLLSELVVFDKIQKIGQVQLNNGFNNGERLE